ncbi:DGF-1-like protein, putative, partial [Bodo saltans]
MIADPINVLSNTTYVLENAVVTTASQYTRGFNVLTLGLGYSKVVLRNVTFNVTVYIRAGTFVQRSVEGYNTINVYNCTFNMDLRLHFGNAAISTSNLVLWYLPVSATFNRCIFREIFHVGNAPPRQSNISLLSSEVFMTSSQTSFFAWERATLYNSRLQIEHVTCNMNNIAFSYYCVYFINLNANEKSLLLLHDVSVVSTVETTGVAQPGFVVGCYRPSNIQSSSIFYLSHLSSASVTGFFMQEFADLIASGGSAIVFENFVVSSKTGRYGFPPIYINESSLIIQSQSFVLLKRINTFQESLAILGAKNLQIDNAYLSLVECETMGGGGVLSSTDTPLLVSHTVTGKCNLVEGVVSTDTVFTQTPPCAECLSDAECFMPLTTSTAGCVCTCAAGGFGPRCLPVDTSLITTLGGDADLHPVDFVVENMTIGSTIYHLATRSVTWRNVTLAPNAEVFFALDKMFLGMEVWAGQPLVITLENCTLPPGAAIYFWGSMMLTMSNRAQIASGMNLTISGLRTAEAPTTAGVVVFVATMPLTSIISVSDSNFLHAAVSHDLTSMSLTTSALFASQRLRLTQSSHLSFLRISHRTSGNFMLLNRTLTIEHGSSLMFDACQLFTTTATFIRVHSGVTTVINGSALLLRNSTVGDPTLTYSTFHFADATTFSLGSVLLFENSNLLGGDSSLVTAMNGISFLTNSMFALFGNTLGRSSSLTGSYTLTVASNSSFVARTNNFALSSGGVAQSSITAPFLMLVLPAPPLRGNRSVGSATSMVRTSSVTMPIEEINFRNGTSYTFINVTFGFQNVSFDLNQFDINTPTINIYFENCTMANTRLYFSGAPLLSRAFVAPVNITIRNSVMTNGGLIGFAYFFPVQSSILIDGLKLLSDVPSGGFSAPFQGDSDSSVSFGSFTAVNSTIIIRNSILNTTNRPVLFVTSGLKNTSFMFVDSISYPGLIQTANAVILTSVLVLRSLIYGPTTTQIGVLPSLGGSAAAPAAVILEDSILFGSVYPYGITTPANGASFISRSIVDFTSMLSSSTQAFSNGAQYVLADSTVSQTQTFSSAPTGNFTNYVVQ